MTIYISALSVRAELHGIYNDAKPEWIVLPVVTSTSIAEIDNKRQFTIDVSNNYHDGASHDQTS